MPIKLHKCPDCSYRHKFVRCIARHRLAKHGVHGKTWKPARKGTSNGLAILPPITEIITPTRANHESIIAELERKRALIDTTITSLRTLFN